MVKVAVLLFRDEVAPRFGACRMALVVGIDQGVELSRELLDLGTLYPEQIPGTLARQSVQVLICGGIHPRFQALLEAEGIELYGGLMGSADAALGQYRRGELRPGPFVCRREARGGGGHRAGGRRRRGRRAGRARGT